MHDQVCLCPQVITAELNKAVDRLLKTLLAWQEREKHANPLHAASHKRVLSGLRCAPQRSARLWTYVVLFAWRC